MIVGKSGEYIKCGEHNEKLYNYSKKNMTIEECKRFWKWMGKNKYSTNINLVKRKGRKDKIRMLNSVEGFGFNHTKQQLIGYMIEYLLEKSDNFGEIADISNRLTDCIDDVYHDLLKQVWKYEK